MANGLAPYYEAVVYDNATIDASTRLVLPPGLGAFNHITVRLVVGEVSGGSDAIDFDLDTSFTRAADGTDTWVELISMTQATGATSESKFEVKDGSTGWADRFSVEVTVAAGATATGVSLVVVGSMA